MNVEDLLKSNTNSKIEWITYTKKGNYILMNMKTLKTTTNISIPSSKTIHCLIKPSSKNSESAIGQY